MGVAQWRRELIQKINAAETRKELNQTSIYYDKRKSCIDALSLVLSELKNISEKTVMEPNREQLINLINLQTNMDFLFCCSFYLEKEREERDCLEEKIAKFGKNAVENAASLLT